MDAYLQCLKTLRTQMNDVEDQAVKVTSDEQIQVTLLQNLESEINSVKCKASSIREEIARIFEKRGQICSLILEKQKKFASLEADSSTLNQTLELLQQERNNLSAKLLEKSDYYAKMVKDLTAQLREQQDWIKDHKQNLWVGENDQDWIKDHKQNLWVGENDQVMEKIDERSGEIEENQDNEAEILKMNLEDAKTKLNQLRELKSKLAMENSEVRRSAELMRSKMIDFKTQLTEMDSKSLEEEYQALLSDKAGEAEYLQSLQHQIAKLMRISHSIKCSCGEEFKIDMDRCA